MSEKNSKVNGKRKGNIFENKISKILSNWIFNDKDVLKRHPREATDTIYIGDIIPYKQLNEFGWNTYPFYIQCKSGYKQHSPDFWTFTKVKEWLEEAVVKIAGNNNQQNIIWLIIQFKNRPILFITNYLLNEEILFSDICIKTEKNKEYYIYKFNDILKHNFNEIYQKS